MREVDGDWKQICHECARKETEERVEAAGDFVQKPGDFAPWDSGDVSELFWIHLGRYVKEPNEHSLHIINMAVRWAHHDSHAMSNSFEHALRWAGIDLFTEWDKWKK